MKEKFKKITSKINFENILILYIIMRADNRYRNFIMCKKYIRKFNFWNFYKNYFYGLFNDIYIF